MKYIKKIFLIFSLLLLSGCVKNYNTMTINKDKSMLYDIDILISNEFGNIERYISADDYRAKGFNISSISEENYNGVKITKQFDNIDDLSNNTNNEVIISDFLNDNFDISNMFKVEKSFFKNTYSAKFIYKANKSKQLINSIMSNSNENIDMNDYSNLSSEIKLYYEVNLPDKIISNNATNVKDNKLTWDLSPNSDTEIEFSFIIKNYNNIFILLITILVILVILIILLILIKTRKKSKETLIHRDYDPLIADKIDEIKNSKQKFDRIPEDLKPQNRNLEYELKDEEEQKQIKREERTFITDDYLDENKKDEEN